MRMKSIVLCITMAMLVTVGMLGVSVFALPLTTETIAEGNAWSISYLGEMRGRAALNIDLQSDSAPDEWGSYGSVKFGFGTFEQIESSTPEAWWWGWNVTQVNILKGKTVLYCLPSDSEGSDVMYGAAPVSIIIRIGAYEEGARLTANGYNFRFTGEIGLDD